MQPERTKDSLHYFKSPVSLGGLSGKDKEQTPSDCDFWGILVFLTRQDNFSLLSEVSSGKVLLNKYRMCASSFLSSSELHKRMVLT